MKINFETKTIEITKWTDIKAANFECDDRQKLMVAQEAHPDFQVVVEELPFPEMKSGKGATYDFMECYILLVTSPRANGMSRAMKEFVTMRKSGCSYFEVKNWFVKKFRFDTLDDE